MRSPGSNRQSMPAGQAQKPDREP
uniref:Uncharacterized protein n=1 Tax=Anguilla anguilla TaxID=7936 RepID=A0A0E9RPL9_ANGAN